MNTQSSSDPSGERLKYVLSTLNKYKLLWILPAIVGMLLAAVYAYALRPESWSARQSLIVRDDLLGQSFKPGRFESLESMKSAQETIFEISRKPQVIRNTLKALGPPSKGLLGLGGEGYPSDETIEQVQGAISFSAPNGAEFGMTEVIILSTKESSRERSKQFIDLLVDEIIVKVNEVRRRKFQSMESELQQNCVTAEKSLEFAKTKLRESDRALGQDAGSGGAMGDSSMRDDPIKREIAQLNLEKRAVESEIASASNVLKSLVAAKRDKNAIVNISSELTKRQPQLDSLKQELAAKKGLFALEKGRYTMAHPKVQSAQDAIVSIESQIRQLLGGAIKDMENYLGIQQSKSGRLTNSIDSLTTRLVALSESRADSMTLSFDVKKRSENLNKARSDLAEVQGLASSRNADLLTKVDNSQVSTRPDGMGKKSLILCGGFGGLLLGIGMVMMFAPPMLPEESQQANSSAPALADVGLESAKSGIAATANVLRDIIRPKSQQASANGIADGESLDSSEHIQHRLSGIATKPEAGVAKDMVESLATEAPKPTQSFSDIQSAVKDAYSAQTTPAASEAKAAPTFQIPSMPQANPVASASAAASPTPGGENSPISPANLAASLRAAQGKKAVVNPVAAPINPVTADPGAAATDAVEAVDKAFESELRSMARPETQTIDLSSIKNTIDQFSKKPIRKTQIETSLAEPKITEPKSAKPNRGVQIKPRSANVRPVDIAKSASTKEVEEVIHSPEPAAKEAPKTESPKREFTENPFLKDRIRKKKTEANLADDDSVVVPVPDQIKKLSESIANFAMPIKKTADSDSGPEKF